MNAPALLRTLDAVYLLALAAWVGSALFFSFGVAPILSRVLPPEHAARFVRALFPRYYAWGATAAAVALPALVCGPLAVPELRGPAVGVQALLIVAAGLTMLYAGNALTPAMDAARDAGPAARERFERLRRRSVSLNGVALILGVLLIVAHAFRPAPRTAGIVEPNPAERARRQREDYLRHATPPPPSGAARRSPAPDPGP